MKTQKMPQKKRWSVKCILICAFIIIACGAVTHDSPVKDLKPEKVFTSESVFTSVRYEWPMIPFEPVKYGKRPAFVPVLHRVEIGPEIPKRVPNAVVQPRLKALVDQNFVPEVAGEMSTLMHAGKITFGLAETEVDAAFDISNGRPRILLNVDRFMSLDSESDVVLFMILIAHEFVHYKQWARTADASVRTLFNEGHIPHVRDCLTSWIFEREAYQSMCRYGNNVGFAWTSRSDDPRADICARVNSNEAFDQAFYYMFSGAANKLLVKTCDDIWWNLAGGPHS